MYLLWAPQTDRAMLGHGFLNTKLPSTSLSSISFPEAPSIIPGSIPKNGRVAEPGFVGVIPANGAIT